MSFEWAQYSCRGGGLQADGGITRSVLIVSAIGLRRMPLSVTKGGFPFALLLIIRRARGPAVPSRLLTRWTNRETANRKVRTPATCAPCRHTQTGRRMFGMWLLCQVELRRVDTSSESLGGGDRRSHYVTPGLFIDSGEVELDPNRSPRPRRAPPPVCEWHLGGGSFWNRPILSIKTSRPNCTYRIHNDTQTQKRHNLI